MLLCYDCILYAIILLFVKNEIFMTVIFREMTQT